RISAPERGPGREGTHAKTELKYIQHGAKRTKAVDLEDQRDTSESALIRSEAAHREWHVLAKAHNGERWPDPCALTYLEDREEWTRGLRVSSGE
ncbi:MAG: hypothetical protein M1837_004216, partial [Sclerophora amabilis]